MANKEKQAENKEKIGIGAWLALIVLILVLSGAFRTAEGPIKVLDFTNLAGSFGQIGDTGANLIGKGGTGAKDGFMAGFNLDPGGHVLLRPARCIRAARRIQGIGHPVPSSASSAARHPRQVRHRIHLELYRFGRCGRHDP